MGAASLCLRGGAGRESGSPSTSLRAVLGVCRISNLRGINTIGTNDTDNTRSHKYSGGMGSVLTRCC
jgi:hypothetical protein